MKRTSRHILKYQTLYKTSILEQVECDVLSTMNLYIKLICSGKLLYNKNRLISSSVLPDTNITHSKWKNCIYREVVSTISSLIVQADNSRYSAYRKLYSKCIKKNKCKWFTSKRFSGLKLKPIVKSKYFSKPEIKNFSISLSQKLFNIQYGNHFDLWISLILPWIDRGKWTSKLKLPIKQHRQSLKYKGWNRKNSIRLLKKDGKFHIEFIYEKEDIELKIEGTTLGIDQGYKTLLSCSDGQILGKEIEGLYHIISSKQQGSKAFKRLLTHRNNEINRICNKLDLSNIKEIVLEDLKYLKYKPKLSTKIMNTMQRWSYPRTMFKLESLCQTNGILVSKVNPAYTSQKCSQCGYIDKRNRAGLSFLCLSCGHSSNADFNAARNLATMGVYSPHT